jgi:hypothetical protein
MNRNRRIVHFATPPAIACRPQLGAKLIPERAIEPAHVALSVFLAAILWSMIAAPALMI